MTLRLSPVTVLVLLMACSNPRDSREVKAESKATDKVEAKAKTTPDPEEEIVFAVLGDFGEDHPDAQAVADLINGWGDVQFVVSLGDNNYGAYDIATYEDRVCGYYAKWAKPAATTGTSCTAATNEFYSTPGNHDSEVVSTGSEDTCVISGNFYSAYAEFFDWPDKLDKPPEDFRDADMYYSFSKSAGELEVQLYAFNSNCVDTNKGGCHKNKCSHGCSNEGCSGTYQAMADKITATQKGSTAAWSLVYLHHSPYAFMCEGDVAHEGCGPPNHGPCGDAACDGVAQLDFASSSYNNEAGRPLAAILTGHNHYYGRFTTTTDDQIPFYIIGTGGSRLQRCPEDCTNPAGTASALCYVNASDYDAGKYHGAMKVTATATTLVLDYYTVENSSVVDSCTLTRQADGSQQMSCAADITATATVCSASI